MAADHLNSSPQSEWLALRFEFALATLRSLQST